MYFLFRHVFLFNSSLLFSFCFFLILLFFYFFFFFSSRRRHTRWTGDWSSDVWSSDLDDLVRARQDRVGAELQRALGQVGVEAEVRAPRLVDDQRDVARVGDARERLDVGDHPVVEIGRASGRKRGSAWGGGSAGGAKTG